jgi:hypothetical protein
MPTCSTDRGCDQAAHGIKLSDDRLAALAPASPARMRLRVRRGQRTMWPRPARNEGWMDGHGAMRQVGGAGGAVGAGAGPLELEMSAEAHQGRARIFEHGSFVCKRSIWRSL